MNNDDILIIAEAGVNHNGDLNIAKRMIEIAKQCGADIIKFQTANVDDLVIDAAPMAEYQKENIGVSMSQKDMIRRIMLPMDDFQTLADYCKKCSIQFLSAPFDIKSVEYLDKLQNIWKIPSGEITNFPYLVKIAKTGKNVILSTGMSSMEEVRSAVMLLQRNGSGEITLLHCTTQYPAPFDEINLRSMISMKEELGLDVGYSDHTVGIEASVAAVALGAKIIEKHFTLNKMMNGPDHKASLEPDEFKNFVHAIHNTSKALGDGVKKATISELNNRDIVRKSIVAARDINKGELLTEENLTTKRPGTGVSADKWYEILETKAIRCFHVDEMIQID